MAVTFLVHERLSFPLSAHIDNLYYVQGVMPYRCEKVFPSPTFDLKINLGGAVGAVDDISTRAKYESSWCVGVWSRHHVVEWPEQAHFVGVSFKPGGAYAVLGIPLSDFHDRVVPLDEIWPRPFVEQIRDRLWAAGTPQNRLTLVEEILSSQLRGKRRGLNTVRYALSRIARNDGTLTVRTLCEEIGISHRHFISLFRQVVGGTPKELARLYRFTAVLERMNAAEHVDLTSIAHEGRYFDQSHFCKDFRAFTAETPTDYLRRLGRVRAESPDHSRHVRLMTVA